MSISADLRHRIYEDSTARIHMPADHPHLGARAMEAEHAPHDEDAIAEAARHLVAGPALEVEQVVGVAALAVIRVDVIPDVLEGPLLRPTELLRHERAGRDDPMRHRPDDAEDHAIFLVDAPGNELPDLAGVHRREHGTVLPVRHRHQ